MNLDLYSTTNFLKPTIDIECNNLMVGNSIDNNNLYKKISKLYNIELCNIELFNDNTQAIYSLLGHFDKTLCYIYSPAPIVYNQIATKYNYTIETINRYVDLKSDIEANTLIIFANPSMPDGSFYDIEELLKIWKNKNCTILIDETFLDFTSFKSAKEFINEYNNLYILKSFEKFYAKFNISLVSIISNSKNINKLQEENPPLKISNLDNIYIQHMLKDKSFAKVSRTVNITNKEYLYRILENSKYISKVFPSSTNYVLVQLKNINFTRFQKILSSKDIIVKDCSSFDFLDDSFARISVRREKELKILKSIIF